MSDIKYMNLAIELAKNGIGYVNPNPLVGSVIVKDGFVIGEGYHERYGELHAERNALKSCIISPNGATIYVTLEPCCHHGKTPPCTEAIIESGISRVVIGCLDPNPIMSGKSVELLRKHNIEVEVGILEDDCKSLIKVFSKFITTKKPYVMMKYAMTMDGKIATYTNKSKWISSEASRLNVQKTRHEYSAIMVGVNTIIYDNPLLTCRLENGKNPIRIICDTNLRTPLDSNIITTSNTIKTIIATSSNDEAKKAFYRKKGCVIITINKKDNYIDLQELIRILGDMNIDSILLEGGSTLNYSALNSQIVDSVQAYISPKIFGGTGKSPVSGLGVDLPSNAFLLTNSTLTKFENDYLIESDVIYPCSQE